MKVKRVKKSKKRITRQKRRSMLEFEVRKNGGKNKKENELINEDRVNN